MADPNFPTGAAGLIAVDKIGGVVLFLDPTTYETTTILDGFAPRPHELAIAPDHRLAYVPLYGDGIHGRNPHPGHLLAVIDLATRRHVGDLSTAPHVAPHGLQWGPDGLLYCVCENSGVVLALDPRARDLLAEPVATIDVGSNKAHRIVITPDGAKLYTENEEDPFASVLDLRTRRVVAEIPAPNGLAGIGISPDGTTVVLVDAKEPQVLVVDTATDQVTRRIRLDGHEKAAQIARYSPNGRYLVVTSYDAPLATIFDAALGRQRLLQLGKGPMNMGFHPDGRTVLIANHDEGTLAVVDLDAARVRRTVGAGTGVETLAFYGAPR